MRAHHRVLADQVGEGRGPVFAREHAIAGRRAAEVQSGARGVVHVPSYPAVASEVARRLSGVDSPEIADGTRKDRLQRDFGLALPARAGMTWIEGGRLTSDPNRSSLGLLPSGPDPVGEWLVHRQPPASYIGRTKRECKRRLRPPMLAFPRCHEPYPEHPWQIGRSIRNSTAIPSSLGDLPLSRVLVMNDANYPWVDPGAAPPDITEVIDLDETEQTQLMAEVTRVARALRALTACHKLNIAALGNAVPQLHVHVIARFRTDAAWPKPVWGVVPPRAYHGEQAAKFVARAAAERICLKVRCVPCLDSGGRYRARFAAPAGVP